jgi:hypothetical protein
MPAVAVIFQVALALLPLVTTGVTEFIAWINSLKGAMQQAGEWTPEYQAAYRAALLAKGIDPAYQPDKP